MKKSFTVNGIKIKFQNIVYLEKTDQYLLLVTETQNLQLPLFTIDIVRKKLPKEEFLEFQDHYIIAVDRVTAIDTKVGYLALNASRGQDNSQKEVFILFKPCSQTERYHPFSITDGRVNCGKSLSTLMFNLLLNNNNN